LSVPTPLSFATQRQAAATGGRDEGEEKNEGEEQARETKDWKEDVTKAEELAVWRRQLRQLRRGGRRRVPRLVASSLLLLLLLLLLLPPLLVSLPPLLVSLLLALIATPTPVTALIVAAIASGSPLPSPAAPPPPPKLSVAWVSAIFSRLTTPALFPGDQTSRGEYSVSLSRRKRAVVKAAGVTGGLVSSVPMWERT